MDWLDMMTEGITLAKLLTLHLAIVQLQSNGRIDGSTEIGKQLLEALSDLIKSSGKSIELLEKRYKQSPMVMLVCMKLLQFRLENHMIAHAFTGFEAKEFAYGVTSKLADLGNEAIENLSKDQNSKCGDCALAISELTLLHDALQYAGVEKREDKENFPKDYVSFMKERFGKLDKNNLTNILKTREELITEVMGSLGKLEQYNLLALD